MTRCFSALKGAPFFQACAIILVIVAALGTSGEAWAAKSSSKAKAKPRAARTVPAAAPQNRLAELVIDAQTGRILHEVNGSATRHPASLTKMMTLYLAFQAIESGVIRLETPLPVSANAASQSPSKLGLKAGQTVSAYDAIMGLVTESANDAAVVLAEALGGNTQKFAEMMVRQAKALGMRGTVFQNPNGLPDPNQITTARDMAMLGYGLIAHYPGFYPYFSRNSFTYKGRVYNNHNNLMKRYEGMDGIKTGYIRASGFNLVASATRGETRLIGVIFGGRSAASRDNRMAELLDEYFPIAEAAPSSRSAVATLPLPSKSAAVFGASRYAARGGQRRPTLSAASRSMQPRMTMSPATTGQSLGTLPVKELPETEAEENVVEEGGAWGIQVGAYSNLDSAQQAMTQITRSMGSLLEGAEPSLQKVTMTDGTAVFRARFRGISQEHARDACVQLIRARQGCIVIAEP